MPGNRPPRGRRDSGAARRIAVRDAVIAGIGATVALLGLCFATVAAVGLIAGDDSSLHPVSSVGLIFLFVGLTVWGLRIAWEPLGLTGLDGPTIVRRICHRLGVALSGEASTVTTGPTVQERITRLAEREHGRLTVLEVAARCGLTAEEAKAQLDELAASKAAELHVTDAGVLVYVFPKHLSRAGRAARRRSRSG